MHRFTKVCSAFIVVVAVGILPPFASASPVLTESGSAVAAGKNISFINEGNVVFNTSAGPITCTSSTFTGPVITNSGTEIAVNIESAIYKGSGVEGKCLSEALGETTVTAGALPWCAKFGGKLAADMAELRGGKCSESVRSTTTTFTSSLATCRYVRTSVTTSVTTNALTKTVVVTSSQTFTKEEPSGFLCSSSMTIEETVDPETAGTSTPLTVS